MRYLSLYIFDVCGPFDEPDEGGYLYFITFIDDQSDIGMYIRYKSEAFERFKEFRCEVKK